MIKENKYPLFRLKAHCKQCGTSRVMSSDLYVVGSPNLSDRVAYHCPVCSLCVYVPSVLTESTLQEWINLHATRLRESSLDRTVVEGIMKAVGSGFPATHMPLECPRCGINMRCGELRVRCLVCGEEGLVPRCTAYFEGRLPWVK